MKNFVGISVDVDDNDLNKCNIIYRLIFPNEKYYIGKTTQTLRKRLHVHCSRALRINNSAYNTIKYQNIREYSTFKVEILYQGNNLDEKEVEFIDLYKSYHNGCNLTLGGNSGFGYIATQETREKISKTTKGKSKNKNPILQFSLENEFIHEWTSLKEAGLQLHIDPSDIGKCCRNTRKTAGGFI